MANASRLRNRKDENVTERFVESIKVSDPFGIDVKPTFVIQIEKPKESLADLCMLAESYFAKKQSYNIRNSIITCNDVVTSISPYAFNSLSESEKNLVAKFPNSDMAIALLQKSNTL